MLAARHPYRLVSLRSSQTAGKVPRCRVLCRDSDKYVSAVLACESKGDVLGAVELFTELRLLKVQLPHHAVEAGIRTFANGGQWQRAVDLYEGLTGQGQAPAAATTHAVLSALASSQQVDRVVQLLQVLAAAASSSSSSEDSRLLSGAYNLTIRTCAKGGALEQATRLLEEALDMEHLLLENATFSTVAHEWLKAGDGDKAEEILDMRDYL